MHSGHMSEAGVGMPAGRVSAPVVSVVLVGWNSGRYLEGCLRSVFSRELGSAFEVILVDNKSSDDSVALVRERFPQVRVIENEQNVGFAAAANQGIRASLGQYVLLLNCDTIVNGPSIDAMVEFMDEHHDAGAVGGRLLNPDGSFQSGAAEFSTLRQELLIALRLGEVLHPGYPSHKVFSEVTTVDWMSGACLLIRREAFGQVGPLDEDYFMYSEEVDWQFRLKRAGWSVYYLPHVSTIHYGGGSQDRWRRRRMVYGGKILFYSKNYRYAKALALRCMLGTVSLLKLAVWSVLWLLRVGLARTGKELSSNRDVLWTCLRTR